MKSYFSKNFLWGAGTSAFQVEGAARTNGKGLSIADERSRTTGLLNNDVASDEYHHIDEDIELASKLGLKAYRFSIAWTRVLPNGDLSKINEEVVRYYHHLIDSLLEHNIEPIVTMFHFDYPMALIKKYGGWLSKQAIPDYVKYAKFLLKEYGDQVHYWLTINEQEVIVSQPAMLGIEDDDPQKLFIKAQTANFNMYLAQAEVINFVKKHYPNIMIGPAISFPTFLPASMNSEDILAAKQQEDNFAFSEMDIVIRGQVTMKYQNYLHDKGFDLVLTENEKRILANGTANYIGLNWYTTQVFQSDKVDSLFLAGKEIKNPDRQYTDWGWTYDPVGLRFAFEEVQDRYPDIPIIITECGWSEQEKLENGLVHDPQRINYLHDHLIQLNKAIYDGVNVIGFCNQSFIDLLSSQQGMRKRYGLIYVDCNDKGQGTLKRYPKDSYYYYQKIIQTNGDSLFNKKDSTKK